MTSQRFSFSSSNTGISYVIHHWMAPHKGSVKLILFFFYFAYLLPFVWAHSCISLPAMLDPRQDIASSSIVHMLAPFCPQRKLFLVITNKALISNGSMEENIIWIELCIAIIISRLLRIIRVEIILEVKVKNEGFATMTQLRVVVLQSVAHEWTKCVPHVQNHYLSLLIQPITLFFGRIPQNKKSAEKCDRAIT